MTKGRYKCVSKAAEEPKALASPERQARKRAVRGYVAAQRFANN